MKRLLACCLLLGLTVPGFAADEKPKPDPEMMFKKLDKNSDGKLSLEEFKGKREGDKAAAAEKAFKAKDKDNDGSLSLEEFKAMPPKKKAE
jgi:Ca2+-binding EF-hand superfamily protein